MGIRCHLLTYSHDELVPCEITDCEGHMRSFWERPDGSTTASPWTEPPGTMWMGNTVHQDGSCAWGWTNCDDRHLRVILPTGETFDCNRRASNCGLPEDTVHRCWVLHGEPPNVTLDKNGVTCVAGAGSIAAGGWHGFLRAGELVEA